jgi:hypothetical protein
MKTKFIRVNDKIINLDKIAYIERIPIGPNSTRFFIGIVFVGDDDSQYSVTLDGDMAKRFYHFMVDSSTDIN